MQSSLFSSPTGQLKLFWRELAARRFCLLSSRIRKDWRGQPEWFDALDHAALLTHEQVLLHAATEGLQQIQGLRLIGTAADKAPIVSFVIDGVHPQDLATLIDQSGVAVRTGHHCAMPTMAKFGIPGTVRASMACYNSLEDIQQLIAATEIAAEILR